MIENVYGGEQRAGSAEQIFEAFQRCSFQKFVLENPLTTFQYSASKYLGLM